MTKLDFGTKLLIAAFVGAFVGALIGAVAPSIGLDALSSILIAGVAGAAISIYL